MKETPRILLIANLDNRSGTGQYSQSLYQNLTAITRGIAIVDYLSVFRENLTRLFFGLKERRLSFLVPLHSILTGAGHMTSLMRLPNGYDLYHVTDGTLGIISRFRSPSVVTVHDMAPFLKLRDAHYSLTDALMRASMRSVFHSEAVICDSHYIAGQVKRVFNSSHARPYVVPLGVDHELFRPRPRDTLRQRLGLRPSVKVILNVGSEEPRKNVPTLLRAFRRLLREGTDAILIRVGARESSEVRHLLSTSPLKDRVLYEKVSREELAQLFSSSDLSVFPTLYEGFGLPVLEAMASGCPVIASNVASLPEVVGEGGVLLDPFDSEGLAKCMTDILESKQKADELSRLGLQQSLQFSWTRTASETWRIIEPIVGRART